jgi:hypothetical protein
VDVLDRSHEIFNATHIYDHFPVYKMEQKVRYLIWVHNKTKPIYLNEVAEKTEEQLNQYEEPFVALQWKVSQRVNRKYYNSFSIH